jgi:hypothetical protein
MVLCYFCISIVEDNNWLLVVKYSARNFFDLGLHGKISFGRRKQESWTILSSPKETMCFLRHSSIVLSLLA